MATRQGYYVVRWTDDPNRLQYWGGVRWEDDIKEAVVYPSHDQASWRAEQQADDGGTVSVSES